MISVLEIERLDEAIMALAPKMIGAVECIEATDTLSGWVAIAKRPCARNRPAGR